MLAAVAAGDASVALSPWSISENMAMAEQGARGTTAAQIARALSFGVPRGRLAPAFGALDRAVATAHDADTVLRTANALYGRQGASVRPAFLHALASGFGAPLRTVDFGGDPGGALAQVNGWVSQQTAGRIPALLSASDLRPAPLLVLLSAVYLHADWQLPFTAAHTVRAPFAAPQGRVSVPTMHQDGVFAYRARRGYRVLELPYEGGRLAFDILLPDRGRLAALQRTLAGGGLAGTLRGLRPERVAVALPTFELHDRLELRAPLSRLGMPVAFTDAADFSGIAGGPGDLTISRVIHEAYIRVDEQGTEAAAATGTVITPTSAPAPPSIRFDVDRPFAFVLRDRATDTILFDGVVSTPTPPAGH